MNLVDFDPIFKNAAKRIEAEYISVPVGAGEAFRERVYCYELYHQLRCEWPRDTIAVLNGELDKTQNPLFTGELENIKPDLLVHKPGPSSPSDLRNLIAIEVKPADTRLNNLMADLKSLNDLMTQAYYQRGILLVYGLYQRGSVERNKKILTRRLERIRREFTPAHSIEIWIHEGCGAEARLFATCSRGGVVVEPG